MKSMTIAMFTFVGVVLLIVFLAGPWANGPMHRLNVREFNKSVAKVERFCGQRAADRFRVIYDPDDDNEGPMQEWVTRCTVGPRRLP